MHSSLLLTGAAAAVGRRGSTTSAVGSGPRTKLPFLVNVVKKAQRSSNTAVYNAATAPPTPISGEKILAPESFKAYPLLHPGETKQAAGSSLLFKDDTCILVNDAFPKSMVHCLVMPLDLRLTSLNTLTRQDVPLLRHMMYVGDAYVHFLKHTLAKTYSRRRFIAGFHALPSLPMLHLHVLSLDLESPCLKNKKHYNSFATFFFLTADRVLEDLERHDRVTINQDVTRLLQMEEQDMRCLWCGAALANVPAMKAHVKNCAKNNAEEH